MSSKAPIYENISIKKLEKSEIEITGQIKAKDFDSFRAQALKNINNEVEIKGFRKGKVPEKTLISTIGMMPILEEMAEIALSKAYPHILVENKIDAIGRPEIKITKMAEGNPLEFSITTVVMPEVKLPDYKKIAKEIFSKKDEPVSVTDEDVEKTITDIRKSRVDHSSHEHGSMTDEEHAKLVEESMPELNNEFVQSIGDFVDVDDFKTKIRENIKADKEKRAHDKKRSQLIDGLIKETTLDVPQILIDSEISRIETQFKYDIEQLNVPMEEYLKHIKKSIEDLRKDWIPSAEKRAKTQMILNSIASAEKMVPDAKRVEEESAIILSEHKNADKDRVAVFVETMVLNEQVFNMLEGK